MGRKLLCGLAVAAALAALGPPAEAIGGCSLMTVTMGDLIKCTKTLESKVALAGSTISVLCLALLEHEATHRELLAEIRALRRELSRPGPSMELPRNTGLAEICRGAALIDQ
jgi:hypothetical protein